MKRIIPLTLLIAVTSLLGACASNYQTHSVDALVMSVEQAPEQCGYPRDNNGGKIIAGGIIGGVAGNQFGGGKGRIAMTLLGTVLGMKVADGSDRNDPDKNKLVCRSDGYNVTLTYLHPITQKKIIEVHPMAQPPKQRYLRLPIRVATPASSKG
jgi:outer membrane lipoprotein SlyB